MPTTFQWIGAGLGVLLMVASAQATGEPYRPFGEDTTNGWFNKFYISGGGGANLPGDLDSRTSAGTPYSIEFNPGFMVQGAIGTYLGTGMVNYYYDFGFGSFKPFLGAGLGLAQIKTTALTIGNVSVGEKEETEFAYQGIIGTSHELSRNWNAGLDGRYIGTSDGDIAAAVTLDVRLNL